MPGERALVFDACAVLAFLHREDGAEVVAGYLRNTEHRCLIHVINACEVYYDLWRRTGEQEARSLEQLLGQCGFEMDYSLSRELWMKAGSLKAQWRRVSLADCFGLALTIQEKATLVTSDHHELDRLAEIGLCPIRFIR